MSSYSLGGGGLTGCKFFFYVLPKLKEYKWLVLFEGESDIILAQLKLQSNFICIYYKFIH